MSEIGVQAEPEETTQRCDRASSLKVDEHAMARTESRRSGADARAGGGLGSGEDRAEVVDVDAKRSIATPEAERLGQSQAQSADAARSREDEAVTAGLVELRQVILDGVRLVGGWGPAGVDLLRGMLSESPSSTAASDGIERVRALKELVGKGREVWRRSGEERALWAQARVAESFGSEEENALLGVLLPLIVEGGRDEDEEGGDDDERGRADGDHDDDADVDHDDDDDRSRPDDQHEEDVGRRRAAARNRQQALSMPSLDLTALTQHSESDHGRAAEAETALAHEREQGHTRDEQAHELRGVGNGNAKTEDDDERGQDPTSPDAVAPAARLGDAAKQTETETRPGRVHKLLASNKAASFSQKLRAAIQGRPRDALSPGRKKINGEGRGMRKH
eukprot:1151342-Rhodomonas_salina.1